MSYKINATDGRLLVDLVDGRIDTESTDLTLIGRNYFGYGEVFNENFIKLLENFSSVSPPANPIQGQIWYDRAAGRLKVYDGVRFRSADTTSVANTEPELLSGDLWINNETRQLFFNDGSGTYLVGPVYTRIQGESGFRPITVTDEFGNNRTVMELKIGNSVVAILSKDTFNVSTPISGFTNNIRPGITVSSNFTNFEFNGIASRARTLVDNLGNSVSSENFLRIDANNVATGSLHVRNDNGILIGNNNNFLTRIEAGTVVSRVQVNNQNYRLRVLRNSLFEDAISVNTADRRIGIWNNTPSTTLDVAGDVRISGNLLVEGETTSLQVDNLRVQDKLIELALTDDSSLLSNIEVDGAGITVRSSDGDKSIVWNNSTNSWTINTNLAIPAGGVVRIGNTIILTETSIGNTITSATGITQVGTLTSLDVDNVNINNATISTSGIGLTISSANNITISNNRKIIGAGTPEDGDPDDTVATKVYVDNLLRNENVSLSLDITGLSNTQIALVLADLYPPLYKTVGSFATIHTLEYEINSFGQIVIYRGLKRFVVVEALSTNEWAFDEDLISSV